MARSGRIATALWLLLALPGLAFGFLLRVAPLPRLCAPTYSLLEAPYPTSGEPCRTIDLTLLWWVVPALVLLVIAAGISAARTSGRRN